MLYAADDTPVTPTLRQRLAYFFFPTPCLACERPIFAPKMSLGLCAGCRGKLVRWPGEGCRICGKPLAGADLPLSHACSDCRASPPPFDRLLTLWSYQPPLEAVIVGLKFQRLDYLGRQLGRCLVAVLGSELADCTQVTAVPLHWARYLRRGYNQAGLIAGAVAGGLGRPYTRLLRRQRITPAQSRLSRAARQQNLIHAFAVRTRGLCQDQHILLIDDVVTTGATLSAAAAALRAAGARAITALTVARTPSDEHGPQRVITAELLPKNNIGAKKQQPTAPFISQRHAGGAGDCRDDLRHSVQRGPAPCG